MIWLNMIVRKNWGVERLMKTFYVSFSITTPHGIFIDAESSEDAERMVANGEFYSSDVDDFDIDDVINVYKVSEIDVDEVNADDIG